MSEQEKKLTDLLDQYYGRHDSKPIVNALLEAFPQINKKPVPIYSFIEGDPGKESYGVFLDRCFDSLDQRDEFIKEYDVEVINDG